MRAGQSRTRIGRRNYCTIGGVPGADHWPFVYQAWSACRCHPLSASSRQSSLEQAAKKKRIGFFGNSRETRFVGADAHEYGRSHHEPVNSKETQNAQNAQKAAESARFASEAPSANS